MGSKAACVRMANKIDQRIFIESNHSDSEYEATILAPKGAHFVSGEHCMILAQWKTDTSAKGFWRDVLAEVNRLVVEKCDSNTCSEWRDNKCEYWG